MKGIYLGAFKALHEGHEIIYQDINGKRDLGGDMLDIDLTPFDYIIATPPCNYYSRANYRRETSEYSQKTKHLLPTILKRLCNQDKPFIVENVRNGKMFKQMGLFDLNCFVYLIGRHTYFTNVLMETSDIVQIPKVIIKEDGSKIYCDSQNRSRAQRQGGEQVHQVIERFINTIGG